MGRRRTTNLDLPPRMQLRRGRYYYVPSTGTRAWIDLGKDKAKAMAAWARLEAGEALPLGTPITLGYLMDRYLREVIPEKAEKTQAEQKRQLERLRRVFGELLPEDVQPVHIGKYLDGRKDRHGRKAGSAANREIALLSHIYTKAMRWGFANRNPCRGIERNKEKPRDRYITDEEYAAVLKAAPPAVRIAMELAYYTGQRLGDVLKMRWSDVQDGRLHVTQGKTAARLDIEITPELNAVLARARQSGKLCGLTIVHNRHGQAYTVDGFESQFARARENAGVKDFHFHDIRAKAATDAESFGDHVRDIQALLGHASITTTEIYLRAKRVRQVRAVTRIVDGIVDGNKNGSGGDA